MTDPRITDLELVKDVFNKFGAKFILVYGACLGWYRDNKFLPGDDDIDLAVVDPIPYKTRKDIGWALYDLGFKTQEVAFNVFGRLEFQELGYNGDEETGIICCKRNIKFTIFFFKKENCKVHGDEFVCIPKYRALRLIATPARFYECFDGKKIGKYRYLMPHPLEQYLEFTYGDWKDKTLRNHGLTYLEMHPEYKEFLKDPQNAAAIWNP